MNNPVTAIYENGILRPLAPLNLPEHVQVSVGGYRYKTHHLIITYNLKNDNTH